MFVTLQKWLRHRNPDITVAVIKELDRRGTLKNALAGRDEQQLSQLLNFLIRWETKTLCPFFLLKEGL